MDNLVKIELRERIAELEAQLTEAQTKLAVAGARAERAETAAEAHSAWYIAESRPLAEFSGTDRVALCSWAEHTTDVALNGKTEPFTPPRHGIYITGEFHETSEEECKELVRQAIDAARENADE